MYEDVIYGAPGTGEVRIDPAELKRRLGAGVDESLPVMEKCRSALEAVLSYRYGYVCLPLSFPEEGLCRFGDEALQIRSRDLYKNLRSCSRAYLLCTTVGIGVDRLLKRLRITSPAEYFITDAMASAAVESLCDVLSGRLEQTAETTWGCDCRPRYSPGYGDCGIENQKLVLDRLNAGKLLGISLNEQYFMTPVKTITAIMGIKNEEYR